MAFTIRVWVKAGSSQGPKVIVDNDSQLTVYVQEPAHDGRANEAVRQALAQHFAVAPSAVSLHKGAKARYKTFTIQQ